MINALNNDVPYNRFVKLQLAADQMPDAKREDLAALGYSGLGPTEHKEFKLSKDVIESLMLDEWDERLGCRDARHPRPDGLLCSLPRP